ncbi:hypothetical protein PG994_004242 [Apiospora phragmitis]|uniref:Uncharacterized protein n=1 Tax=Apiospora phragmitis TaxID=2905665 RepID=A0ABR1VQ60_9PEZI
MVRWAEADRLASSRAARDGKEGAPAVSTIYRPAAYPAPAPTLCEPRRGLSTRRPEIFDMVLRGSANHRSLRVNQTEDAAAWAQFYLEADKDHMVSVRNRIMDILQDLHQAQGERMPSGRFMDVAFADGVPQLPLQEWAVSMAMRALAEGQISPETHASLLEERPSFALAHSRYLQRAAQDPKAGLFLFADPRKRMPRDDGREEAFISFDLGFDRKFFHLQEPPRLSSARTMAEYINLWHSGVLE